MPLWAFLLCFVVAGFWAFSPILIARGRAMCGCSLEEVNPFRSVSFFVTALVIALVLNGGALHFTTDLRAIFSIFAAVIFGYVIGDLLCFAAIKELGVSLAMPVSNLHPVLIPFTTLLLVGEPVSGRLITGILIVMSGLVLLNFDGKSSLSDIKSLPFFRMFRGVATAFAAALSWSLAAPFTKLGIIYSGLGPVDFTFNKSIAFLVAAWGVRLWRVRFRPEGLVPLRSVPLKVVACFAVAASVGLCLGSEFQVLCYKTIPVAVVMAITSTSPFIAALYGHFVLKNTLNRVQWAGIALTITGSVIVAL